MTDVPRLKTFEVKPFLDVLLCKVCPDSTMLLVARPANPAGGKRLYEYKCPECGAHETYALRYPHLRYSKVYPE